MNIWDENKLLLFIVFSVPGFIAIKTYELLLPSQQFEPTKQIIDAVSYSCINYALWIWPIYHVQTSSISTAYPNLYVLFWMYLLFISPVLLAFCWKSLRECELIQNFVPHPTQKPWDYVFSQRGTYWVVVTLKDGKKIAGMYGPKSFASSAPAKEQIYLEEHWILNKYEGFDRSAVQTAGIIILSSEISTLELMHSGEHAND